MVVPDLSKCVGFDWDLGNLDKNWEKHKVTPYECEQIFFNRPLVVNPDASHPSKEARYFALGRTDADRLLFLSFTVCKNLIRIISARDVTRRENEVYEGHEENNP